MQLIGVAPTDCTVLSRMGEIYDNDGDKSQAFQYYYDVSSELNFLTGLILLAKIQNYGTCIMMASCSGQKVLLGLGYFKDK